MRKINTADEKAAHMAEDNALEQAEINAQLIADMTDSKVEAAIQAMREIGEEEGYARLTAAYEARKEADGFLFLRPTSRLDFIGKIRNGTYYVLHVLSVAGDKVICDFLVPDTDPDAGEVLNVQLGTANIQLARQLAAGAKGTHDADMFGGEVQTGNVYVFEIDYAQRSVRVVAVGRIA